MSTLTRYVPLLRSLQGGYGADDLRADLLAGLTTAVMLVPQAMAYALLAGLPPYVGLYASVVPIAVYAVLGTSRQLAVGPVAMVSLLVATGVGALGVTDTSAVLGAALALSLLVGVLQLGMGVAKLGALVNLLSHPVIAGFTSAAALIIGASQLKHVLGVDIPRSHHVHEILGQAWALRDGVHPVTLAIGVSAMVALVLFKRYAPQIPRFLVVVTAATLAVWGLGLDAQGVNVVGEVPAGLPPLTLPPMDLDTLSALLPMALTISFVGFLESISVAKAFVGPGSDLDADQELRALGAANLAASVTGGYPVTGGFSRTAVNAQAGAHTGIAGLITAGAVAITLLFLTPLFTLMPKAVLAAIILTAVAGLVNWREARHLWTVSKPDLALMGLTFVATLTLGIEQGILVGVAASIAWFVRNTSVPHVAVLGRLPGTTTWRKLERNPSAVPEEGVIAVRMDAPLIFANVQFLETTLSDLLDAHEGIHTLVLDATTLGSIDASGAHTLVALKEAFAEDGVRFLVAGARGPVRDVLVRAHFAEEGSFPLTVEDAVQGVMPLRAVG